jgi:hypothetical protein
MEASDIKRTKELEEENVSDISKTLNKLVDQGYLIRTGQSRGASYHLTMLDYFLPKPDEFFGPNTRSSNSNTLSSDIQRDELGRRISNYTIHRCPY